MNKIKVFIPVDRWAKDYTGIVIPKSNLPIDIHVKEAEGYFFTADEFKDLISGAIDEGFLNTMSKKDFIESLNIK